MALITKEDLRQALKNWEIAREKAALQHDAWGALLKRKHEEIKHNEDSVMRSMISAGYAYQRTRNNPNTGSTFDNEALLAAMSEMADRERDYLDLKEKFIEQQSPQ